MCCVSMFSVEPVHFLFDQPVKITAEKLKPGQRVGIRAYVECESGNFESYGEFLANNLGKIDVTNQISLGGSFKGSFFWNQSPSTRLLLVLLYLFDCFRCSPNGSLLFTRPVAGAKRGETTDAT